MKNWLRARLEWLDEQSMRTGKVIFRPPALSHPGGVIRAPLALTMIPFSRTATNATYPTGVLYYTLDNSDPRLPGGAVSPGAVIFRKPLVVESSVTVNARLFALNQWSPLATASFFRESQPASLSNVVISEILYQPMPLLPEERAAGVVDSEKCEFVELLNRSTSSVDMSGVRFSVGVEFDFDFASLPARLLRPGESVVVVADRRAFQLRNPRVPGFRIAGQYRGQLNNGGETLTLTAKDGRVIQEFRFNDKTPWPAVGTGEGYSLVRIDPIREGDPANPDNWIRSAKSGGTPGVSGTGADRFVGGATADADGDGLSDLLEFFAGSDPLNPNSANRPEAAVKSLLVSGVADQYLTLTLRRNPAALGLTMGIESSRDLKAWHSADADLVLHESHENSDGTISDLHRGIAPWTGGAGETRFFRLRIANSVAEGPF